MSLILDEHREYLADEPRVSAFRAALRECVRPDHAVLDLGAGTGILGLLASEAGARRVYAVDDGGIIGLARRIASDNGLRDRIAHIRAVSTWTTLPEPVDLVVTDQIGRFGFDAGLFEYLADARRRLLKPDGATIPSTVELWVAPVDDPATRSHVEFWAGKPAGFDMRAARAIAVNTGHAVHTKAGHLLGENARLARVELASHGTAGIDGAVEMRIERAGRLDGVAGWFVARLSPSVAMSNSPLDPRRINRRNALFPIDRPVDVQAGDVVSVAMRILPANTMVRWDVAVTRGSTGIARFRHSTFQGMLMSAEDLARTRPDRPPRLSRVGEARKAALVLCDSRRTLAEIEPEMLERFPDLFASRAAAAAFVSEILIRYAE